MALIDLLKAAEVTPADRASYGWTLHTPDDVLPLRRRRLFHYMDDGPQDTSEPLVSCLTVTTGERGSIRCALECYRRQLYQNRELVIVTYLDRVATVRRLAAASGVAEASVHGVGRDLALADMRNVSIGRASGEILIQWDDDDLYDPARITVAATLLSRSTAVAALQQRVLIWWPERGLAAVSAHRLWEPSIAVWRAHAPVYPSLERMEDAYAIDFLSRSGAVLGCDEPLLYVHVAHGAGGDDRFDRRLGEATCVLRGDDYAELIQLLAGRMPILDYV